MRFLEWAKDGGKDSNVDAFFLIELKGLFSIAFLRFRKGCRQEFHSHAFNALTVMLKGVMKEEFPDGSSKWYNTLPKLTKKYDIHRVRAYVDSYAITFRGPWDSTWFELDDAGNKTTLTHGRKVLSKKEKYQTP